MLKKFRVACIQTSAGRRWPQNRSRLEPLLRRAVSKRVHLIALPETFVNRDSPKNFSSVARELTPEVLKWFRHYARRSRTAFLLGSMLEASRNPKRFYNTSFLISAAGRITARYRKIHLFDIGMRGKAVNQESRHIIPGRRRVIGRIDGVGLGLSVCYDLRFPELYRQLARGGARILFVPANFTRLTGQAHWEVLLRARAIENQAFVVAPGQAGRHPATQVPGYGHSMIIDPWGRVLRRAGTRREALLVADLDLGRQAGLRRSFPVLEHRKLTG